MTSEPYCNHDTAAIRDGVCECGARPHVFATPDLLAAFMAREFGDRGEAAGFLAKMGDGDLHTVDVGVWLYDNADYRVVARISGWWLLLPYRSPEAEARRG